MIVKKTLEEYRENIERLNFLEQEIKFLENNISDIQSIGFEERIGATNKVNNTIENNYIKKESNIERIKKEIMFIKHKIEQAELFITIAKATEDSEILRKRFCLGINCNKLAYQMHLSERAISKKVQNAIKYIEIVVNINKMKYEMAI